MRIDIHTHAFHPRIAHKVVEHLNAITSKVCAGDGMISSLLEREAAAGIDKCVVLCAATSPDQVIPANNYAIQLHREHPEVIAFGTIHPDYPRWQEELARLKAAGLHGLKLHPDLQGHDLDDKRLWPILEEAQGNFVVEIHVGGRRPLAQSPSTPAKLATVLDAFPRLAVIAAHMGGLLMWEHVADIFGRKFRQNLWMDTSSVTPYMQPGTFREFLGCFPAERLLFGTDWPIFDPVEELERLNRAGLTPRQVDDLLGNAVALLCG